MRLQTVPLASTSTSYAFAGMNENPADHVDPAAFQPSHTFTVDIPPGTVFELFEDVKAEDLGKVRAQLNPLCPRDVLCILTPPLCRLCVVTGL
jgi:hypothetical protein